MPRPLLLICCCASAAAQPLELSSTAHFYDTITSKPRWFVMFYAPWCGHCRAMEPEWTSLAALLQGSTTGVARVDATVHTELAALYEVNGFPSLHLLDGGRLYEYGGERTVEAMRAFAEGGFEGDRLHSRPMPTRPSLLDPLLALPAGVATVIEVAATKHPVAGALLAAALVSLGVLMGAACRRPQFMMVRAPDGVAAGEHFSVELPGTLRTRRMRVVAPPGIADGQPFFVPLTAPPVAVRPRTELKSEEEKKSQ